MATNSVDHPAHLDPRAVEDYFRLGVKTAFVLLQKPFVRMEIDPGQETITLTTPATGTDPEVTAFEHISFGRLIAEGLEWFRLLSMRGTRTTRHTHSSPPSPTSYALALPSDMPCPKQCLQ